MTGIEDTRWARLLAEHDVHRAAAAASDARRQPVPQRELASLVGGVILPLVPISLWLVGWEQAAMLLAAPIASAVLMLFFTTIWIRSLQHLALGLVLGSFAALWLASIARSYS